MKRLTVQELDLTSNAAAAARLIQTEFPTVVFTSGRRSVADQARVMAHNVSVVGINWLDIYGAKWHRIIKALKTHVSENPEQLKDKNKLALEFYDILHDNFRAEIARFPHITGRAFDIRWPRHVDGSVDQERYAAVCSYIENLPAELGLEKLLRKEGSVEVIHAQFATPFEKEQV